MNRPRAHSNLARWRRAQTVTLCRLPPARQLRANGLRATRPHPTSPNSCINSAKMRQHEIQIRVRYQETDAQGRVHHANYLTYFEMGRVEFLRAMGHSYRELEASGVMLVVSEMQ